MPILSFSVFECDCAAGITKVEKTNSFFFLIVEGYKMNDTILGGGLFVFLFQTWMLSGNEVNARMGL